MKRIITVPNSVMGMDYQTGKLFSAFQTEEKL